MAKQKSNTVTNSKGTKHWNPTWSQRRYTIRLSPEAEHSLNAMARKWSVESKSSVTVPDLIEQGIDEWLLVHQGKVEAIKARRDKKG